MVNIYSVVVCSECETAQIVKDNPETTTCYRCRNRMNFDELKKFVETTNWKKARNGRAMIRAKINDNEEELERLVKEEGLFEIGEVEEGRFEEQVLEEKADSEIKKELEENKEGSKSVEEKVLEILEDSEVTSSEIVELLDEESEEDIYEVLDKLRSTNKVLKQPSGKLRKF